MIVDGMAKSHIYSVEINGFECIFRYYVVRGAGAPHCTFHIYYSYVWFAKCKIINLPVAISSSFFYLNSIRYMMNCWCLARNLPAHRRNAPQQFDWKLLEIIVSVCHFVQIEILHMEIFISLLTQWQREIDYASMMWIWCVGAMQLDSNHCNK